MQSWLQNLTRTRKHRSVKKSLRQRPAWRARFDALDFAVERLEDRVLLAADLTLDKAALPAGDVVPGQLITYNITAANPAGANVTGATGVTVTDTLPAGLAFVDATASTTGAGTPTVSATGNTITATLGTLAPGDSDTITIQALVTTTAAGTLSNTASMTNTSQDTNPTPANATNTVLALPPTGTVDLSVTKTAATTPATVGTPEVYTLIVKNNEPTGGTSATGVTLIDTLPANATNTSASTGTITGNVLTDSIGTLAPGASATVSVTLTPTTGGTLVNTATVAGGQADPNPANNIAAVTTPVGGGGVGTVDLSVTKTAASNPATVGTAEVYTIIVKNNSTTTNATGVTLVDTLPANVTGATTSAGTIAGNVLTDNIGNLAAGASSTVTVSVTPTVGGVLVNTAAVAGDQVDATPANNIAAVTTPVGGGGVGTVDLSVTKTAASNPATVGTAEVYTIIVKNNSTTTNATGVTLVDTLPANVTGATTNAGTITGNVLTDSIGNLAAGASSTVTVSVTPTVGGVLVNTAAVAGDQVDATPANNVAVVTTPVGGGISGATVDLSLTKTAASSPATIGTAEVYTIIVKNNSTTTGATGVTLVDTLPANANNATASAGTITGSVLTDSIGNLAPGASATVTVSVTPTAGPLLVNTATVAGDQADTNLTNNVAAVTTPVGGGGVGTVDLSVTKTAASSPATVGTAEVYTIIVKNNSTTTNATGVTLVDTLPANANNASSSAGTITGNVLTDSIGSLAAGASATVTVSVTPTVGPTLVNTATVAGDQVDANLTNNVAAITTPVGGGGVGTVDLSVTKTAASNPATVGTAEVYTIIVKNNSTTTAATGVTLVDTLPANANNATSSAGTIAGNVLTDSIGNLAAGASATVTVSVTPTVAGVLVNTAAVAGDQVDTTPANNVAVVTTPVGGTTGGTVDLSVTKTAASNPATVGTAEVYTITVTNNSTTTAATGVTLVDTLPANANNATSSAGTITGNVLTDSIGNLAAGASATVTVSVTPTVAGVLVNTAAVAGDQVDTNPANNVAVVTTPVGGTSGGTVDLSVTKTATSNPATIGTAEVYTIIVKNNSTTTAATGVTLVDTLPANANNATSTAGTITGNVLTDSIGNLAAGASATVTVSVTPTAAGILVNTAAVAGDQVDNNPANNVAVVTTPVGGTTGGTVDLSVTKTAASNPATVGTAEVYTIVVTNNSTTTAATGVTLVDTLPANANNATSTAGTITGNVLTDNIGNLAAGASATVTVSVTPTAAGILVNTAAVAGDQVDNNAANNVAVVTTPIGGTTGGTVDLSVTKTAASNPATVGAAEVYTIVVTNNSTTTAATGVTLIDTLPANANNASSTAGTIAGNVLTDTIGNLAAGASATVTVSVTPTATGSLVNTASVAGDQVDSNLANNVAVVTTPVQAVQGQANLSITKTGPATGTVGSNLTYTITVTNAAGAADAQGVTVADVLPAGVSFVSATDTTSNTPLTNNAGTVFDVIGTLAAGATRSITVVVSPNASTAGTSITDTASVTTITSNSNQNTSAQFTTQIQTGAGSTLTVTKTAAASVSLGQNLVYTITVNNTGGNPVANTVVSDTLPAGVTFVSATDQTTGTNLTNSGGTISDTIPSLAAGASETIQIIVAPTAALVGTSITNTATATPAGGAAVTGSATTLITGVIPTSHVCYLAGVPGDGTATTFVTNLYYELLGRGPDSLGLSSWVNYLQGQQSTLGQYKVVQGFMNSPEYKSHFITCLYETFLGRAPDAAGLQFWVDKMGNPGSPGQNTGSADERFIVAAFLGSDEYYAKAGGTPQGFINSIYGDLLNRVPEANGMNFWVRELQLRGPGDRDGIVRDLLVSPEAAHYLLDMFYPAPGGTANTPLPAVGTPAGQGGSKLAEITGGGWENLYLQGPFDHTQEANDAFFAELAGGANWDDVQLQLLTLPQFYNNPNSPVIGSAALTTYAGGFNYAGINGSVTVSINGTPGSQISGQFTLFDSHGQYLGAATFNGNASGTGTYAGVIRGIAGGPEQFTLVMNGNQISGTLSGPGNVSGTFGPLTTNMLVS